jgi:hypothetical protein
LVTFFVERMGVAGNIEAERTIVTDGASQTIGRVQSACESREGRRPTTMTFLRANIGFAPAS